ncbi:hypothetical protein EW146_g2189 [Bondarzewia mesenterica]|uniref:P-loop containing nucleoside triphosphate hydrolase protein n=1 Tax=Bondarzewia mesenterica TaxID=1095465 RepID=A0A4S4M7R8_9AGAM|nr:hypothetical protein EW146_g2189 [Bondarzewia mesenterica]
MSIEEGYSEKASSQPPTHPSPNPERGFFSRNKVKENAVDESASEKTHTAVNDVNAKPMEEKLVPASFTQMFRFTTKSELLLNLIGLIAAVAAGAAQPLMSLMFSNLTQDFIEFGIAVENAKTGIPGAQEQIPIAAANFRRSAAKDSSYLVYIGVGMFVCTYTYIQSCVKISLSLKRLVPERLRRVYKLIPTWFSKESRKKVALVVSFLSAFVTGFVLAYIRNWRLALAMTTVLPCMAIAGAVMTKFVSKDMQLSLKHVADGGSLAEEVISTVRTAQAFGTQKVLAALYDLSIQQAYLVDTKAAVWHGGSLSCFFFVIYSSYALAFSFGTTLINESHATPGQVINVFMAILIGSVSLALMAPEMQAITHGRGAAAKLYATIDRVPDIDSSSEEGLKPEKVMGEVSLEHLKFNYPSRPDVPIVKDLTLTFPAGKTAALVGASGSGKSTIISLVERFYDPLSGVVRLDGIDLKELNVKWLRSQIGLVSQEPTLFATTIKGNVAHGLINTPFEHVSEEEKFKLIKEAFIKSNADGFISKLPLGYETMVGERGFLLSGGQKQRIAIARAIVSDPKVLLLDEATSALDTQSEGVVQNALDKAAAGRTTITIAHRLSTIKDADCIYVMGDGLVLEKGKHNDLLQVDGPYARLVAAQKLRDTQDLVSKDVEVDSVSSTGTEDDVEKAAEEEIPLGRRNTQQSLASAIMKQRKQELSEKERREYSVSELFMRMAKINKDEWRKYVFGSIFAIMTGAVYPAFGIVWSKAVNGFSLIDPHARRHAGDRNALWLFVIAIVSMVTIGMQNFYFAASAASLTNKLRSLSFRAVVKQDIEYFDRDENSTGTLVSNLSDGPQKINGLAGITLGAIVQSISTLIIGLILGLIFIWKVGLVGLACVPLLISTGYIRLRVVVLKDQENKKAHEQSAQLACEAAASIRTVASLTREADCLRLYSESLEEPMRRSNRTAIWSNGLYSLSQSFSFFVIALVFWYGSRLISFQEFSTFDFFIGLMVSNASADRLGFNYRHMCTDAHPHGDQQSTVFGAIQAGNVFSFVPDISLARGAASDIIHLMDSQPEVDAESTKGKIPQSVRGEIQLENVHFRYPTRPGVRVLRGLDVVVKPGTYIALVGASGCGKSTVIQLVERFYDPLAGRVLLDGQDISEMNVQEYRKNIALVSQEPTLYAGTIKFNILLGAAKLTEEVTQEELEDACRNANILEFIRSLPNGFDTDVGGKGSQLSGGQKQRIAIARALLRNPKVLLLDEATSALDSNSEKIVQAALDSAAKGRTTIAIAHRLSTIQNADCIYFIKQGHVSEAGTHDELLALRGGYYEYVQLQALSKK